MGMKEDLGLKIVIEHEQQTVDSAKFVLDLIKKLNPSSMQAAKNLDTCSDELNKIISSSETFIKLLSLKSG